MRITIEYMAQLRRAAGTAEDVVDVDGACTVAELLVHLTQIALESRERFPPLAECLGGSAVFSFWSDGPEVACIRLENHTAPVSHRVRSVGCTLRLAVLGAATVSCGRPQAEPTASTPNGTRREVGDYQWSESRPDPAGRTPLVRAWLAGAFDACRGDSGDAAGQVGAYCIEQRPSGATAWDEDECRNRCLVQGAFKPHIPRGVVEACVRRNVDQDSFAGCDLEYPNDRLQPACDAECARRAHQAIGQHLLPVAPGARIDAD